MKTERAIALKFLASVSHSLGKGKTLTPASLPIRSQCCPLQTPLLSTQSPIRGPTTLFRFMFCFFCTRLPSSRRSSSTCASSIVDSPAPNSRYRRAGSSYVVHHRPSGSPRHGSTPPARRIDRNRLVQRRAHRRFRYVLFPGGDFLLQSTLRLAKYSSGEKGS